MITETLTLKFENAEQQRRFHERLNAPEPAEADDAAMMERFQGNMVRIVERAVLAEREACAKSADDHFVRLDANGHVEHGSQCLDHKCNEAIAKAIRARSN